MKHWISTAAWVILFIFLAGFYAGTWFGNISSPANYDAKMMERHFREIFCERAIANKLVQTCEISK